MAGSPIFQIFVGFSVFSTSILGAVWYPKPFHERRLRWNQPSLQVPASVYDKPFPHSQHSEVPINLVQSVPAEVPNAPAISHSGNTALGGEQTIVDHGDTFLTISLEIGSQQIKAIPDSGSFELYIVDGDDCDLQLCRPAYKPDSSSNHFTPKKPLKKDIYFGSGTCGVELSFDSVKVHNEQVPATGDPSKRDDLVPLWRIVEMDENLAAVWGDGEGFQGIVGLGFKGNSNKDSRETLLEEQVMIEAREKTLQGHSLTKPGFASKALFGDIFAICLPRGEDAKPVEVFAQGVARQDDGRLWWGKQFVPHLNWVDSPVVGTRHWTISIESSFLQQDASNHDSEIIHTICGGPGGKDSSPCAALVDSGTSLIAMSEVKIRKMLATTIIGSLNPDCSNVDEMPDLVFNLGRGQKIVLTPDTYVMKIRASDISPVMHEESSGRVVLEKGKVLNIQPPPKTLVSLKSSHESDSITYCTHAFMETPMETALVQGTEHELIILGIPIFREYSVKFDREKEVLGFAEHPFGTTCHDLVRSDGKPVSSSLAQQSGKRHIKVRSLGNLRNLVFPDEFASL